MNPDQLRQVPAGAVLRLAGGQFGQLYYLLDTTPPVPAVLLFGVAVPQPLHPADFPVELICTRQVPRSEGKGLPMPAGAVLDEVADPGVSELLTAITSSPDFQPRPDTIHPVLWHRDGSTTVLEPQEQTQT